MTRRRATAWAATAAVAIGAAAVLPSPYYWWRFRTRLRSLPAPCRRVAALVPDAAPPPILGANRLRWRGIEIPVPCAAIACHRDAETRGIFQADAVRLSVDLLPSDLPRALLRQEMEAIGGHPDRVLCDPREALRRIGRATPETFRLHLGLGRMEAHAAAILAKLRLIPHGRIARAGWAERPPGVWVAYGGSVSLEAVWALRLLPDRAVVLRAWRARPGASQEAGAAGADLTPWVSALGGAWGP